MADARFQRAEEEYFVLRGQFAAGRITRPQFDVALKQLMVQDAQGRYWSLGADDAQWYMYDGKTWARATPEGTASTLPPPQPPSGQNIQTQSTPAQRAPTPQAVSKGGGGCGCRTLVIGCLAVVLLCAALGAGGYFALQRGVITQAMVLNWIGQGPGDIEVDNFRDDRIVVSITQQQFGNDPTPLGDINLNAFDVKSFRVPRPGMYRVEFVTGSRANIGVCTLNVRSGDVFQFVTLPDNIVVNRVNSPASVGRDLIVSTSSLCR